MKELKSSDSDATDNPFSLFSRWLKEAEATEPSDANAMALATVDHDGMPNVRMVLLKHADERGFVFYTNTESAKGTELLASPKAALVIHWKSLARQFRVRGDVTKVSDEEADAYFASRPRQSRIGAWASQQSRPLDGRLALEKAVAAAALRFGAGAIPRPPYWTGFRIVPHTMEFWQDKPFRLHERRVFLRQHPGDLSSGWRTERLFP